MNAMRLLHALPIALAGTLSASGLAAQGDPAEELKPALAKAVEAHANHEYARCAQLYLELYERSRLPHHLLNAATCQYNAGLDPRVTLHRVLNLDPPASETVRNHALRTLEAIESEAAASAPVLPVQGASRRNETVSAATPPAARATPQAIPLPAYVLGAVSVVGLGVSSVLGIRALGTWNEAKRACPDRPHCPDDLGHELSARALRQGNVATAALVGSAAAAAGALLFWRWGRSQDSSTALRVNMEQGALSLQVAGNL